MKKDTNVTLRINSELKQSLKDSGHSLQQIFDKAVAELVTIEPAKVSLKKYATIGN